MNQEQREAVIASGFGLVDLGNSPVRIEDNASHTEEIIDALFPSIRCCAAAKAIRILTLVHVNNGAVN